MNEIEALKTRGNTALAANDYDSAISAYSEAILIDSKNHVLCSNRSAAYAKAGRFEESLQDAEETIRLNPLWAKGYSRKIAAQLALNKPLEAFQTLHEGLKVDPSNPGLQEAQAQIMNIIAPQFNLGAMAEEEEKRNINQQRNARPTKSTSEDDNLPVNKRLAKRAKEQGNEAYKTKNFEAAIKHYSEALEHDPTDITFYNNLAAVYFEQKDYQRCIEECQKGIEVGRENRADFKLIAKAFTRIGNAYRRQNNWNMAKIHFEKAMSEHRTPEVKTLLSDVEKKIKEEERQAYINPEKAEEEKNLGNDFFKKGEYSSAIKHYSEAIKRNPDDPKLYSNRAACYTKLGAFDLGLKDCEACVQLDEMFIKGWIRKGKILQGMQQPSKAATAYQKALEIDPTNVEAMEGYRACITTVHSNPQELSKKALEDPEIIEILKDPAMRYILQQMQSDPKAVQDHLNNPDIAAKMQKLLVNGIIHID